MNTRTLAHLLKKALILTLVLAMEVQVLGWAGRAYARPPRVDSDASLYESGGQLRLAQGSGWLDEDAWDDDKTVNRGARTGGSAIDEPKGKSGRKPPKSGKGIGKGQGSVDGASARIGRRGGQIGTLLDGLMIKVPAGALSSSHRLM